MNIDKFNQMLASANAIRAGNNSTELSDIIEKLMSRWRDIKSERDVMCEFIRTKVINLPSVEARNKYYYPLGWKQDYCDYVSVSGDGSIDVFYDDMWLVRGYNMVRPTNLDGCIVVKNDLDCQETYNRKLEEFIMNALKHYARYERKRNDALAELADSLGTQHIRKIEISVVSE